MTPLGPRRRQSVSKNCGRRGWNGIWQRLTRRRLRLWFIRGALFRTRAHQVHEVPADFFRRSVAFARHLPLAVANNPKELAVGHLFDGRTVAPVAEIKLHVRSQVTLTVTAFAVAHRAIVAIKFACLRHSFGRWRDGIFFGGVFGRHLWLRGPRLVLRGIRHSECTREAREQNYTQDEEHPLHSFLLT